MELRFQLKHQEIKRLDRNVVASGSRNYVTARFIPITDDWSGIVTAIFGDYLGHHRTIVSAAFAQSFAPSVQL